MKLKIALVVGSLSLLGCQHQTEQRTGESTGNNRERPLLLAAETKKREPQHPPSSLVNWPIAKDLETPPSQQQPAPTERERLKELIDQAASLEKRLNELLQNLKQIPH